MLSGGSQGPWAGQPPAGVGCLDIWVVSLCSEHCAMALPWCTVALHSIHCCAVTFFFVL
jgi:hypothetical protein